jgi:hypothetical protein
MSSRACVLLSLECGWKKDKLGPRIALDGVEEAAGVVARSGGSQAQDSGGMSGHEWSEADGGQEKARCE